MKGRKTYRGASIDGTRPRDPIGFAMRSRRLMTSSSARYFFITRSCRQGPSAAVRPLLASAPNFSPMAVTREQKAQTLEELRDKFARSKGVVFAQYRGISVNDLQEMRKGLRKAHVDYKVAKKTLVRIAAKEKGYEIPPELMEGPIGLAFGYDDEIVAAQKMQEFTKKFDKLKLIGGLMEGKLLDAATVKQLASIPSRQVLLAQLLDVLQGPVRGFVGTLHGVVSAFVRATNAYKEKKAEGESSPAPAAPSEPEAAPEGAPAQEQPPAPPSEEVAAEPSEAPAEVSTEPDAATPETSDPPAV